MHKNTFVFFLKALTMRTGILFKLKDNGEIYLPETLNYIVFCSVHRTTFRCIFPSELLRSLCDPENNYHLHQFVKQFVNSPLQNSQQGSNIHQWEYKFRRFDMSNLLHSVNNLFSFSIGE